MNVTKESIDPRSLLRADDYPVPAFSFLVTLTVSLGMGDTSFREVSGIGAEMKTEEFREGGENRYVHHLPTAVNHPTLTLKRGIGKISSPLVVWCKQTLELGFLTPIVPMPVVVSLLNENGNPVRSWAFANAFPVNWDVESFDSTKNEVAIEKIELRYTYLSRLL